MTQSNPPRVASTHAPDAVSLARQMAQQNHRQRLRAQPFWPVVAVIAVALGVTGLAFAVHGFGESLRAALIRVIDYPLVLVVIVAWLISTTVARQRRAARQDASRSWLAALPLDVGGFERSARRRMLLGLVVAAGAIGLGFAAIAALVSLPQRTTMTILILTAAAMLAGFWLGWSIGGNERRTLRLRLPGSTARHRNSRHALGRWPLRHSRAHADISLHARAIGALLLSLPMGTPGFAAICIIVIGVMGFACWDLLRALLAISMQAGGWLRSLPLRPLDASVALLLPSLVALLVASSLLGLALLPSGISPVLPSLFVASVVVVAGVGFPLLCRWQRPFGARR